MRTRLASLIIVKQEPLSNEEYLDSEHDALLNYNDVDSQFYGLSDSRRDFFANNLTNGDLNNNNSNNNNQEEFDEDKKCTYFICCFLIYLFVFLSSIVSSSDFWIFLVSSNLWKFVLEFLWTHFSFVTSMLINVIVRFFLFGVVWVSVCVCDRTAFQTERDSVDSFTAI